MASSTAGFYVSEFVPVDAKALDAYYKKMKDARPVIKYGSGYDINRVKKVERNYADLSVQPERYKRGLR